VSQDLAVHQPSSLYKRHWFPGEVISHAVWLSYQFLLSYRDVEELLAERGIAVSDETVRWWRVKFGQAFADGCGSAAPDQPTHGIWTRCSGRATDAGTGSGAPLTRTEW
jgi:hypothetical protein